MGNTLDTQNCLLQVYDSGGFSVLTGHKYRTDHSILFYIYQEKITETSQAVLGQLNGRIKWVNEKGREKILFAESFQMSTSLKIKKLIIYCTDKLPRQKKMWAVLGFDYFPQAVIICISILFTYMLIMGFILIEESVSFV